MLKRRPSFDGASFFTDLNANTAFTSAFEEYFVTYIEPSAARRKNYGKRKRAGLKKPDTQRKRRI